MINKLRLLKSAIAALGIAALTVPTISNAQTIVFAAGGSSALQANYLSTGPFSLGAVPQLLTTAGQGITGFKTAAQAVFALQNDNVILSDGAGFFETVDGTANLLQANGKLNGDSAFIIFTTSDNTANGTPQNVVILVRTDSGQGVRYAVNANLKVVNWGAGFNAVTGLPAGPYVLAAKTGASGDAYAAMINFLNANVSTATENIWAGFSDVAAETIIKFAPQPGAYNGASNPIPAAGAGSLNPANFKAITVFPQIAVQTLLFLYNTAQTPTLSHRPISTSRDAIRELISGKADPINGGKYEWFELDFGAGAGNGNDANVVDIYVREPASGTRNTELLTAQRDSAFNANAPAVPGQGAAAFALGTGAMLNAVQGDPLGFGYAFVTGTAGNGKGNVRVALAGGIPFEPSFNADGSISLPGNGTQPLYTAGPVGGAAGDNYYANTALGSYPYWAYATLVVSNAAPASDKTVANTLGAAGTGLLPSPPVGLVGTIHGFGISIQNVDMAVSRTSFNSPITNETVFDGGLISGDPAVLGGAYIAQ